MSIERFTTIESVAAPMPDDDIDTDVIFPARFLTLTAKRGLGRYAFHDRRHDEQGATSKSFVLDRDPYREARILVAGSNFGCGSSREQAPWALADLGIRCIVALGFGAIFEANCLRNGLLPIKLAAAEHAVVMRAAHDASIIAVDLERRRITSRAFPPIPFAIDDDARLALLEGRDGLDVIRFGEAAAIARFEALQRERMPWLFAT